MQFLQLLRNTTLKQRLIGGSVILAMVGLFIFAVISNDNSRKTNYLKIVNLSEYTEGRPSDAEAIQHAEEGLYNGVSRHRPVKSNGVKDFRIREGTFEQIDETDYHKVSFIVDSEEIRESFSMFYQWGDQTKFEQYGSIAFCVSKTEVIFPSFNCKDPFANPESTPEQDELVRFLPYATDHYAIKGDLSTTPISIVITINLMYDEGDVEENKYRDESLRYLMSTGINLGNYLVVTRVLTPNIPIMPDKPMY
jgi:hypothetical protein